MFEIFNPNWVEQLRPGNNFLQYGIIVEIDINKSFIVTSEAEIYHLGDDSYEIHKGLERKIIQLCGIFLTASGLYTTENAFLDEGEYFYINGIDYEIVSFGYFDMSSRKFYLSDDNNYKALSIISETNEEYILIYGNSETHYNLYNVKNDTFESTQIDDIRFSTKSAVDFYRSFREKIY